MTSIVENPSNTLLQPVARPTNDRRPAACRHSSVIIRINYASSIMEITDFGPKVGCFSHGFLKRSYSTVIVMIASLGATITLSTAALLVAEPAVLAATQRN